MPDKIIINGEIIWAPGTLVASMSHDFNLNLTRAQMAMTDERVFRQFLSARLQDFGDTIMAAWRERNAGQ